MTRTYVDVTQIGYTARNWVVVDDRRGRWGKGLRLLLLHNDNNTMYTCDNNRLHGNNVARTIIPCAARTDDGRGNRRARPRPHCAGGLGREACARGELRDWKGWNDAGGVSSAVSGRWGRGGNCFMIPHSYGPPLISTVLAFTPPPPPPPPRYRNPTFT